MAKKQYSAPRLSEVGDIRAATRGSGSDLTYDGGLDFFARTGGGGGGSAT